LVVLSHRVIGALVHRPELPLWASGVAEVGVGLWNSVPATLTAELAPAGIGAVRPHQGLAEAILALAHFLSGTPDRGAGSSAGANAEA
jgi:hypothetical protein